MYRMKRLRCAFVIVLLIIGLITVLYTFRLCVSPSNPSLNVCNNPQKHVDVTSQIDKDELIELARTIHKARLYSRGIRTSDLLSKSLHLINRILNKNQQNIANIYNRETVKSTNVCPEIPTFPEGSKIQNCSYGKPLFQLITIILDPVLVLDRSPKKHKVLLDKISKFLSTSGKNVPVIVPSSKKIVMGKYKNEKIVHLNITSIGDKWKTLIKAATTKYVLIARRVDLLTEDMRLESLIREMESQRVVIAGGAIRDENGHWRIGCKQSAFRNYTITYEDGYFESLHGCVYCDHIDGPFVAVKNIFHDVPLNSVLPEVGLFEDFFLRLKAKLYDSIICPDSMFFIESNTNKGTKQWEAFAKHLDLYKLNINNQEIIFPCEIPGRCSRNGFVNSPCCLREQSNGIKFIMKLCEEENVMCELDCGTTLGAIKFSKTLPWDIDADISYLSSNHSVLIELKPKIIEGGYGCLIGKRKIWCCTENRTTGGDMYVYPHGNWNIELLGYHKLDIEMVIAAGMKPTRVYFDGVWLICPTNPGLYVKLSYGPEVYRHAQHWRHLGMPASTNYHPESFTKCPKPHKHSCMDQYRTDGGIQLSDPVP